MNLEEIKKPLQVNDCNKVGKFYLDPSFYKNTGNYYTKRTDLQAVDYALTELEKAFEESKTIHESNVPIIEHNKKMRDMIISVMEQAGVAKTYSEYTTPTARSRSKKWVTNYAGYISDLNRLFKISDGFTQVEESYKRIKSSYTVYKEKAIAAKALADKEVENKETERKRNIDLATLIVRYNAPEYSDWEELLDIIRSKNKYLDLAIAMEDTRGDWSDGFYRVENALSRFTIESDLDKEIAADVCGCARSDERDGRIFRDTCWNYDKIFELVDDKQLIIDINKCQENINRW